MAISLSDQYVLLSQNVVNKNRLLREQMKNTVDQTKSSLDEIKKKVDNIENLPLGRNRVCQTGPARSILVPKLCRVSFH